MKMKTNYGFKGWPSVKSKDDLVPSQNQGTWLNPKYQTTYKSFF
jgi:hypothetical protein